MELLKVVRKKLGIDQLEMAEKFGVSRTAYAGWEGGSRKFPLPLLPRLKELSGMSWARIGAWLERMYPP